MKKKFLIFLFFISFSSFSFCADEEAEIEDNLPQNHANNAAQQQLGNQPPLPHNPNPLEAPHDNAYGQLQNKWCYERCEYHWWNMSACGCRMIGGFAGTIGYLSLGGAAVCTTLLGFTDFNTDVKFAIGAVGIAFTALSGAAFKIRTSSFKASTNRENFADDLARTGTVSQQHLNQADENPPV